MENYSTAYHLFSWNWNTVSGFSLTKLFFGEYRSHDGTITHPNVHIHIYKYQYISRSLIYIVERYGSQLIWSQQNLTYIHFMPHFVATMVPSQIPGLDCDENVGDSTDLSGGSHSSKNTSIDVDTTPPKFNIAPEKRWLEDYFPIGKVTFQGLC